MATITTTALIDDLDGSHAEVTVTLTVGGQRYRVDLSKANYNQYVAPLVKASRPSHIGRPAKDSAGARKATKPTAIAKRSTAKPTSYSKLSAKEQAALRVYLQRPRGRIADDSISAWKASGKPKS